VLLALEKKLVYETPTLSVQSKAILKPARKFEVTFKSNDHESQISVRVINGVMEPDVSDKDRKHDNTVPDSSESASHGGGDN